MLKPHTEFPGLQSLPELLKKNRRTVAAQIRITTQERQEREDLANVMALGAPNLQAITCTCEIGGQERAYELRRYVSERDGKTRVKVIPIR